MLPFTIKKGDLPFKNKDYIFVPEIRKAVEDKLTSIPAYVVNEGMKEITLTLGELTDDEREIILKDVSSIITEIKGLRSKYT